ncbi:phosphoglucomutase [Kandleria vitulina DSM 20405]|jgi:phosphoglucomutase|uniref:Phosphoglucomutase n=1 Tax=Kandleria vitulina DSM 20405 TaxID=1410657 RepID=A0A0R2HED6_9FIRM|nr:phospho-sugar mutase [Kandleria vitulina]KRN51409.1 phosphoglucomutase [Kandleria vitulina DSM 20405]MEE0988361.1 phospho-sugar mutase [Kandleria vitulina]SDL28922.1 alpha-phosphoglucomutase [Kandleria vitulina]
MDYRENYEKWLSFDGLDESLRTELKGMDEATKEDAFYKNIEFGTAGMRGLLGAGTNRMNIYMIRKANVGYAKWILEQPNGAERGVAISYDNRHMSYIFANESAKVLAGFGIKTYIMESLRPTPELSFAVRHLGCAGGIMITASHNPAEYNGYKVYDDTGCQLIPEWADQVTKYVEEVEDELAVKVPSSDEAYDYINWVGEEIDEAYYEAVKGCEINPGLDKSDFKIVYSPQHGADNWPVRTVLKDLGYDIVPVLSQCAPDPDYSNTKSPNPEVESSYDESIKLAKKVDADVIAITDPDGDRLGVVAKHNGEYVLMSGNQSAAVYLEYILSQLKEKGKLPDNAVMYNTIVTSDLGELVARSYGVDVEKTLTGFKFIGDKIRKYEKTGEKQFIFGYEESYGCVVKDFVRDKDAVQAVLLAAECGNYYKKQGKDLIDVLNDLYAKHGTFKESQIALAKAGVEGAKRIAEIMDNLRKDAPTDIAGVKVTLAEDYANSTRSDGTTIDLPKSNVLKYYLEDGSWIAARPSGTEPKCKFYFSIKGTDANDASLKTEKFQKAMMEIIGE